nr:unnamed protein product [Spirometra erinaceieuropaei]
MRMLEDDVQSVATPQYHYGLLLNISRLRLVKGNDKRILLHVALFIFSRTYANAGKVEKVETSTIHSDLTVQLETFDESYSMPIAVSPSNNLVHSVEKSAAVDFEVRRLNSKPFEPKLLPNLPSTKKTKAAFLDIWTRALEEGFEVDVVYIDFRKAFDTVPHQRLLHKLSDIGIRGDLLNWIRASLVGRKQRVCIGDDMSEWVNVTIGVAQDSVLGPLLPILYVNDSLQELECDKIMFADDVRPWQVIKSPNDNLRRLQTWSEK